MSTKTDNNRLLIARIFFAIVVIIFFVMGFFVKPEPGDTANLYSNLHPYNAVWDTLGIILFLQFAFFLGAFFPVEKVRDDLNKMGRADVQPVWFGVVSLILAIVGFIFTTI